MWNLRLYSDKDNTFQWKSHIVRQRRGHHHIKCQKLLELQLIKPFAIFRGTFKNFQKQVA